MDMETYAWMVLGSLTTVLALIGWYGWSGDRVVRAMIVAVSLAVSGLLIWLASVRGE